MEELQNKITKVEDGDASLAITKGYGYTNKAGQQRYSYNDVYYTNGEKIYRKHESEKGISYFDVELIDVVVETFLMKDGNIGSKTYPLSETPYLATDVENIDTEALLNFLKFKLHR